MYCDLLSFEALHPLLSLELPILMKSIALPALIDLREDAFF